MIWGYSGHCPSADDDTGGAFAKGCSLNQAVPSGAYSIQAAAPLEIDPPPVPTAVPIGRVEIAPVLSDMGARPAMIGFDFLKRQYIGV